MIFRHIDNEGIHMKKGFTLIEILVVVVIVMIVAVLVFTAIGTRIGGDGYEGFNDRARRVLIDNGYTNIVLENISSYSCCGDDDNMYIGFTATNSICNKKVKGCVCGDLLGLKGLTIRFR